MKYAEKENIKILNLPFNSKTLKSRRLNHIIKRMVMANFVIVTSAGNDGANFGSLYSPANSIFITTVGSYDYSMNSVSEFSSKGPYIRDLRTSLPIYKPDFVVMGSNVLGSNLEGNTCLKKSGTSFSSTIFAGLIAKLYCGNPQRLNLGSVNYMKTKFSSIIRYKSIFEQGCGNLDFNKYCSIQDSDLNENEDSKLFFVPEVVDLRTNGDQYFFPLNLQPVFKSEIKRHIQLTINSSSQDEIQITESKKEFLPVSIEKYLEVSVIHASKFKFINKISIQIRLIVDVLIKMDAEINIIIETLNKTKSSSTKARVKILLTLIPRPDKGLIVLFDNHHNLVYPFNGKPVKLF